LINAKVKHALEMFEKLKAEIGEEKFEFDNTADDTKPSFIVFAQSRPKRGRKKSGRTVGNRSNPRRGSR
jgi:hypothetical protein